MKKKEIKKNILICVCGLTPQVVTESFYCLSVQEKIKIDELYIITTTDGRDAIRGNIKIRNTKISPLLNEINEMCETLKIKRPLYNDNDKHIIVAEEESVEQSDIKTDKQNILFPNIAANFIKEKTSLPNTIVHCSISGGRKAMSVHLAFALSLFGRKDDQLIHVITSPEYEYKNFYPTTDAEAKELVMAKIPFVRLSAVVNLKELKSKTYFELIEHTQSKLDSFSQKPIINYRNRTIKYKNEKSFKIPTFPLALYIFFVKQKNELLLSDVNKYNNRQNILEDAEKIDRFYKDSYNERASKNISWWIESEEITSGYFSQAISKINTAIKHISVNESELLIVKKGKRGSFKYLVKSNTSKFTFE